MKLSIDIVTWNSAGDIAGCLDSIHSEHQFEVAVVDNGSSDSTLDVLSQFHHLKLIRNACNRGYAFANNQGIKESCGEYVLLLNPDTKMGPDAIDRLVEFLDANPDFGAVAPRLVNPDGSTQFSVRSFPTAWSTLCEVTGLARLFPLSRAFGGWRMARFDYTKPAEVDQPMASCLLIRRKVLEQLHGFDQTFPIFYNDVDLSYRMKRAGWKTAYVPDAVVIHRRGASTRQVRPKMIWESHRSLFRYLRKHDRSGFFWFKAVVLLPLLELAALVRVWKYRLSRK